MHTNRHKNTLATDRAICKHGRTVTIEKTVNGYGAICDGCPNRRKINVKTKPAIFKRLMSLCNERFENAKADGTPL